MKEVEEVEEVEDVEEVKEVEEVEGVEEVEEVEEVVGWYAAEWSPGGPTSCYMVVTRLSSKCSRCS